LYGHGKVGERRQPETRGLAWVPLQPFARRAVVMHGHRHIDWIGTIGDLRIVSASSPVMGGTDDQPTYFLIHRLTSDSNGNLGLLEPERIEMPAGEARQDTPV